jgi:hypothetical protein
MAWDNPRSCAALAAAECHKLLQILIQETLQDVIDITFTGYQEFPHSWAAPFGIAASDEKGQCGIQPARDEPACEWVITYALIFWSFTLNSAGDGYPCCC